MNPLHTPSLLSEANPDECDLLVIATKHTHRYAAERNWQSVLAGAAGAGVEVCNGFNKEKI